MSKSKQQPIEPLLPAPEESQRKPQLLPEREPSPYETAMHIADQLAETGEGARKQLVRIVLVLGRTQARALLSETLQIEESGGMLVPDGSRRRTLGGIYFHLVYGKGTPKEGKVLRRYEKTSAEKKQKPKKKAEIPKKSIPTMPASSVFLWEDRITLLNAISAKKGTATTVKITLVGKFGKTENRGGCIIGVMQSGDKVPALPKGVPTPPATKTDYIVYIGAKQWKSVAVQATDPDDAFIIEGYPQIDTESSAISVFATSITSKKLQAAKRQGQPQG